MAAFRLDPSVSPPGGLKPEEVPQFIVCSFDDNYLSGYDTCGGLEWVIREFGARTNPAGYGNPDTFDGFPIHFSFFVAPEFKTAAVAHDPEKNRAVFYSALEKGHELGVHTLNHKVGALYTAKQWEDEISGCAAWINRPGYPLSAYHPIGFRAPYLKYNPAMFTVITELGYTYDASLEEGFDESQDGTNYIWPYTLHSGSPSSALNAGLFDKPDIGAYPGLMEIPIYALVPPPEDSVEAYGIPPGLTGRMEGLLKNPATWHAKITGIDWNLFYLHKLRTDDILAVLKHTLSQHIKGNRCPMTLGFHSDIYSRHYNSPVQSDFIERQRTLTEFLAHALSLPEARIVSNEELIRWLNDPVPLSGKRPAERTPA